MSDGSALCAVVFDFDGVIRHFDQTVRADIERRYGVQGDALRAAAFGPDLGQRAVTGQITRARWIELIGEATGAPDAAAEWLGYGGYVDPEMVRLIGELRSDGLTVALLTNGTDTIPAELAEHDLGDAFDHIFNSADIGLAKPDPAVYQHVLSALDLEPEQVFFTDDRADNVAAAVAVGIHGHIFGTTEGLRTAVDQFGRP